MGGQAGLQGESCPGLRDEDEPQGHPGHGTPSQGSENECDAVKGQKETVFSRRGVRGGQSGV